jgi:SNF2 family DNA or RNA helicase
MDVRDEIVATQLIPGKFNVCVTTYEALHIMFSTLKKYPWVYAIFDEAHKLKGSETKVSALSR